MASPRVALIDYSMGNLRSVGKALELAGATVKITTNPGDVKDAAAVVLPGVGSFGPAIKYLRGSGMLEAITGAISAGKPFLGLCLGFQLLFDYSSEGGKHNGLGFIPGAVKQFRLPAKKYKVPHMGWNRVFQRNKSSKTMFRNIPDGSYFYFVHSYYGKPSTTAPVAATTDYGIEFCSAIVQDNIWACQFHPEKSSAHGLQLLKNFIKTR
ncbi:MAG: imidazole glycerol phosphate synthase, glutamine amidotransferase subunit [Elusimicrobia bacterium RIFOXYA2_FULL_50_26]|nr:MAG: imidazole glycerol phosphate synthase, glutamine amidotransferase subunit [Elusimicrobia bacterium RIFOXYA2_FULL_50_26]OGS23343.1 MAG: imidazole glycerol phosphate synthase, glutamine amidotransferase subunit [Elusimicrobia bacterium RIFOXYB2_FULL_50_12]